MLKKVQVAKGMLSADDGKGFKKSVDYICVQDCTDCMPDPPCDKEVMFVKNPDVANEWYQIDLVELAKSLAAPVVTIVTK